MIKKYNSQLNNTISSKLKSYSALTGAFLLSAGAAKSQVVYTDIDPDTLIHNNTFDIDLDNDGIKDFGLYHMTSTYYEADRRVEIRPGVDPNNKPMAAIQTFMFFSLYAPLNLPAGNPIGPGGPFYSIGFPGQMLTRKWLQQGMGMNFYWTARGPFYDSTGYIGVEFHSNGNTHYGWIECAIDTGVHGVLLTGFAYDATPNHYIIAGAGQEKNIGIQENESLISPAVSFYPNPVTNGKTFIRIEAKKPADLNLEIMNGMGQILQSENRNLSSGKNVVELNVGSLKTGTYFVKLSLGKEIYFRKILVNN